MFTPSLSAGQTDNALSSLTRGLQGLTTVVGQATPGLQSLSHAAPLARLFTVSRRLLALVAK
jgi:hypothetical protein